MQLRLCVILLSVPSLSAFLYPISYDGVKSRNEMMKSAAVRSRQGFCPRLRSSSQLFMLGHQIQSRPVLTQLRSGDLTPDCELLAKEKLVKTFRLFLQESGSDNCTALVEGAPLSLSFDQVTALLEKLKYSKQEIECVFKQIDLDGNGRMTEEEFIRACYSYGICAIEDDDEVKGSKQRPIVGSEVGDAETKLVANFLQRLLAYTSTEVQPAAEQHAGSESALDSEFPVGKVTQLSSEQDFDRLLEHNQGKKLIVLKFFASWCRKCLAMKPKYERLAAAYGSRAVFVKIDVEKGGPAFVKERAGVVAIPTFQIWKGDSVVEKYVASKLPLEQVATELAAVIDRNLDCGFSLVDKIKDMTDVPAPPPEPTEPIVRETQVDMDGLAAWRAAQARKSTRR